MRLAVVIPAAGRGTRLGIEVPKLFAPLGASVTVWTVLRERALSVADHVHVVLSREAQPFFDAVASEDVRLGRASSSLQLEPLGMGDAVFKGRDQWGVYDRIIVMWGDQVGISATTLRLVAEALRASTEPTVVLPLVEATQPYVEYRFDPAGALTHVLQSREGDACAPRGLADVGVFGLSVPGLVAAWERYEKKDVRGAKTGEANFLPFLPYLSSLGWRVVRVEVTDPDEARGINTPDDLAYFRRKLEEGSRR